MSLCFLKIWATNVTHMLWQPPPLSQLAELTLSSLKSLMGCDVVEGHTHAHSVRAEKRRQLGIIPVSACVGLLLPKGLVAIQRTSGRIWVLLEG